MVVALISLFISLGGVSYGVATGSIDGREVKNNTIATKDLKNNDIRGKDVRNNTLTGSDVNESRLAKVPSAAAADNATQLGGDPESAYQKSADILHATVDTSAAGATLVRGKGVTSVERGAAGFYVVSFNRDVSNCTWQASAGRSVAAGVSDFNATPRGRTIGTPTPNDVAVVVWNQAGAQVDGASVFLTVTC